MFSLLLAVAGTVALGVCVFCLIALHIVPTKVQPVRDPVSLYGTTRYSLLYRVQVVAAGICALCLLVALEGQQIAVPVVGLVMLGCYGVARLIIAAFMMDRPGEERTRTGQAHWLLAIVAFTAIAVAVGTITPRIVSSVLWHQLQLFLFLADYVTIISALLFIAVRLMPVLRRLTGLIERGIYLGSLCWLGLMIIPLIHSKS